MVLRFVLVLSAEVSILNKIKSSEYNIDKIRSYGTFKMATVSFIEGYTDAFVGHEIVLRQLVKDNPGRYRYLENPIMTVHMGIAFSLNDSRGYEELLNEALNKLKENGLISKIAEKYDFTSRGGVI